MQVDNLTLDNNILVHTILELDNQAEQIHILVATTEAKQEEGVDHMIEAIQVGKVAGFQQEVDVVPWKPRELQQLETPKTQLS